MCATFIFECVTGIALDVEVLRRCNKCSNREQLGSECHAKTKLWHGKATDLECYTAKILFERSKNLKLKYSTIVCDGDSSSWNHVKNTYGPNTVSKEECIPHFQKRCWKHYDDACHIFSVKSLTKEGKTMDNYPLRGVNNILQHRIATRLSKLCIVSMHSNLKKEDVAEKMSRGVRAIPRHYSDYKGASLEQRHVFHQFCSQSFCNFMSLGKKEQKDWEPESDGIFGAYTNKRGKRWIFPEESRTKLYEKIDENLGKESTMQRCTMWLNQNINESAHARLYYICSKVRFVERERLLFAARHTCITSNAGKVIDPMLAKLGLTEEEEIAYKKEDDVSLKKAMKPNLKKRDRPIADPTQPLNYSYGSGFEYLDKQFEVIIPEIVPNPIPNQHEAPYRYAILDIRPSESESESNPDPQKSIEQIEAENQAYIEEIDE